MLRDGPAGEHHIVSRIPVRDRKNVDPVEMLPPPLKSGGSRQEGVPESLSVDTSNFHPQGRKNSVVGCAGEHGGKKVMLPGKNRELAVRIAFFLQECFADFRHYIVFCPAMSPRSDMETRTFFRNTRFQMKALQPSLLCSKIQQKMGHHSLTKYSVHGICYLLCDIFDFRQLLFFDSQHIRPSTRPERRGKEACRQFRLHSLRRPFFGEHPEGVHVQQKKEMTMVKQRFLRFSVSFFLLFALMLSPLSMQTGFAQSKETDAEKAPFMYSLAATWEGKGIVRYRIAVQPAEDTVLEGLKIVAANPAKGKVSVVTAGAAAAEDKVVLAMDKTTPGKVPMLEYTVLTDAAGPDAVKPVSAEIFWRTTGRTSRRRRTPWAATVLWAANARSSTSMPVPPSFRSITPPARTSVC